MNPLDENELNQLLNKWEAPPAPPTLKRRVFPENQPWWRWLFTGTIRIPVPVALAIAVLLALLVSYTRTPAPARGAQPGTVSLADFQPVRQLEPVVVRGQK